MSRALLILKSQADRNKAISWIQQAKPHTRVEFKAHKRSTDQNSKMWAMLTEVAEQATHMGQRYTPDQWKILFMYACGREVQFLPGLDGKTFLPWGQSTSDLSKDEMTDLIEFIYAWGAENGVKFHDPEEHSSDAAQSRDGAEVPLETPTDGTEGDGDPNPASSPSKDTEAESSHDASDEGGGDPPASSPSPIQQCAIQLLRLAADETKEPLARRQALVVAKDAQKELVPVEDHDKVRSIFQSADAIIKGETGFDSAVEFFAELLGMKVEDFEKGAE